MDLELWSAALIAAGGLVAGFANVVAGGGSLLTMPLLVFVGLPATVANGTVRIAVAVQCLTAVFRYHRAGAIPWGRVPALLLPVLAGAGAGAVLAASMEDPLFAKLLGWVTLAAALLVAAGPSRLFGRRESEASRVTIGLLAALLFAGFYGGLIQAGVGYVLLAALTLGGRFDLVTANVLKVILVLAYTPIAIAVFGAVGKVDPAAAAILALGQAAGAYLGASATLAKGASIIRPILLVAVLASGVKLALF